MTTKPKRGPRKGGAPRPTISDKVRMFCKEYLIDFNGAQAAIRAGYSARSARETAYDLLHKPAVIELLQHEMSKRAQRTEITADKVLQDLWAIAQADARELIELRRTCCRYCWGKGFRYQRTAGEMERDREAWEQLSQKDRRGREFDEKGGAGYHAKRDPNPECTECFGDGVESVFAHDTRKLGPEAARLFAGIKQTRDGMEIKTHDQRAALLDVGKHLGMFRERLEHSGPDGAPLPPAQIVPVFNITLTEGE